MGQTIVLTFPKGMKMSAVVPYCSLAMRKLLKGSLATLLISSLFLPVISHAAKQPAGKPPSSEQEFKTRTISVRELGLMTVYPNESWNFANGPKGTRSVTSFKGAEWIGDGIRAKALWGNGTYLSSPEGIVEVTVRVLFQTDDDALIYVDYLARFDWDEQAKGVVSGPLMTGRVETNSERYSWLNKTQIIGKGSFSDGQGSEPMQMQYYLYALPNSPNPEFE